VAFGCCNGLFGSLSGRLLRGMTRALNNIFSKISSFPPDEQDRIADWLQVELASEEGWARRFEQSQDTLNALADEALADVAAGRTTDLDREKM
jgi:hypothetical protein